MIKKRMLTDRSGKYEFWQKLRRARTDYMQRLGDVRAQDPFKINSSFYDYMQNIYGINLILIDGDISSFYDIVDEKKFMLFQLKYV